MAIRTQTVVDWRNDAEDASSSDTASWVTVSVGHVSGPPGFSPDPERGVAERLLPAFERSPVSMSTVQLRLVADEDADAQDVEAEAYWSSMVRVLGDSKTVMDELAEKLGRVKAAFEEPI